MNDGARGSGPARGDGAVRIVQGDARARRHAVLYQAAAVLLVGCMAAYLLMPGSPTPSAPQAASSPLPADAAAIDATPALTHRPLALHARRSPSGLAASTGRLATPKRAAPAQPQEPEGDPTLDISAFIPPGETPTAGQLIEELHKRGIYDGIAAFPPPGTSPPLEGLAVPEDFELPEGYVRHYQATDDGQRIEPILMFSPDYEFFDENGQPIPIPENGVVPPELAPPGLPIRRVDIPQNRE
ncbi:MAG TPA: hypothetical protein VEC57_03005 [Candidatus Limnocylindrales bacterium]|nr:hypothetical protein [Candidatus Limnocylindrales bacterium]